MAKEKNIYPGVRPRGNSIEIEIRHKGRRFRPTLKIKPTIKNLIKALTIKENIREQLALGNMDISKYFSESKMLETFGAPFSAKITLTELLDMWFESYCKNSDYYPKEYNGYIKKYLKPTIGNIRITDLEVKRIRDLRDSFTDTLTNKTINNIMIPLRSSLALAFNDELIESNPMDRIENLKVETIKVKPLNIFEVDSVLKYLEPTPDHYNFYKFAFWTGLSTGEQLGLKWSDISFEDKAININRMWVVNKIRPVKNKHRNRQLELIQPAIDALIAQKELEHDSEWVFINPNAIKYKNFPWHSQAIAQPWNEALKALNISHRRAYVTRHTYASIMLSAGMSLEWLKERMGHSNFKMLEEVYASWTKVSSAEKRKIREWVLGESQDGHMPEMEEEFFNKKQ